MVKKEIKNLIFSANIVTVLFCFVNAASRHINVYIVYQKKLAKWKTNG